MKKYKSNNIKFLSLLFFLQFNIQVFSQDTLDYYRGKCRLERFLLNSKIPCHTGKEISFINNNFLKPSVSKVFVKEISDSIQLKKYKLKNNKSLLYIGTLILKSILLDMIKIKEIWRFIFILIFKSAIDILNYHIIRKVFFLKI
jgi:hypothetical protein